SLGDLTVSVDRFMRTVGLNQSAQQAWQQLPNEAKTDIDAYVAGINAFLNTQPVMPPELLALRARPEPWVGADVVLLGKVLSWNLGGAGYEDELFRANLVQAVGAERAQQLIPDYATDGLTIMAEASDAQHPTQKSWLDSLAGMELPGDETARQGYAELIALEHEVGTWLRTVAPSREGLGSNGWVVSGAKSTTGKPLLANDPHLTSSLPSTWYLAHLTGGDLDVIGATIPGLPAVVIGRNRTIAWGMTSNHVDVVDLFRERLDADGKQAEFQGQLEPLTVITETIKVAGQADIQYQVRSTRHGSLVSDAIMANRSPGSTLPPLEPLAMQWSGITADDPTIATFLQMNRAQSWEDFQTALRGYRGPSQNFVYADVDGNIGFYMPGHIPLRTRDNPSIPVEGWSGDYEWTGYVPFAELPHSYNPPEQYIVTANNRSAGMSYPYFLGRNWLKPYRAERILAQVTAKDQLSPEDFAAIQADTVSLIAQRLVPSLIELAAPQTEPERQAIELLRAWDGDTRGDSAAAAIFAAWFEELPTALIRDEIGARLRPRYQFGVEGFVGEFLIATLDDPASPWCDDVTTETAEDCRAIASQTLSAAVQKLEQQLGNDPSSWRWDRLHTAEFTHLPLGDVPVVGSLLNREIGNGGNWGTVNIGNFDPNTGFKQHQGPTYRQVIDLSSTGNGQFIQAIGQSGNVLSPHYDDFLGDWQAVRYRPMRFDRETVERDQVSLLRLEP
ncbi:MAG: penicillin acylase family protein, partial [Chloroflexi bacterium]|nr:penicillin acylase family protein [Chloroflexota bacterium]